MKEKEMVKFSKLPALYWSDKTKISYLQRRVLIYSIMYYRFNESCVSDSYYDGIVKQLVDLQKIASEKELKESKYYYVFYDFEGSTGFYLYSRLNTDDQEYLTSLAAYILKRWKENA